MRKQWYVDEYMHTLLIKRLSCILYAENLQMLPSLRLIENRPFVHEDFPKEFLLALNSLSIENASESEFSILNSPKPNQLSPETLLLDGNSLGDYIRSLPKHSSYTTHNSWYTDDFEKSAILH